MTTLVDVCEHVGVLVAFDGFELDLDRYELRRDGERVALEPQVFDVLAHLVRHADRVVTKHELLDEVWGSRFVSEAALTSRIKSARQALGDDGRTQRYIRTVHGRGYRFIGARPAGERIDDSFADGHRDNLPVDRTPLFGREHDVERVAGALDGHRLVSLLGIGGTGKTRLAIAAARAVLDRFPDGVWFVDLVPVTSADGVRLALAEAAGLVLTGDRPATEQLTTLLATRRVLVVFDNAEHIVGELAGTLDHLLGRTVEPRFVVTSRVPLGLPDERRLPISPLRVEIAHAERHDPSPAVALLVSTADRLGAPLDDVDSGILQRICRSLDGIPLAIELAAAQLRHLDAAAVADRLDRRFDVLADRSRRGPERHASLQAVLTDTWNWLDVSERLLLEQLAAFPATFTLDDLQALADAESTGSFTDFEQQLGELVDRSLVVREAGRTSRYRLLETVKLFARQQCDADRAVAIADAHARWCLAAVGDDPRRHLFDFDLADWCSAHHVDLRAAGRHLDSTGRRADAMHLLAATALAMHVDTGPRASATLESIRSELDAVDDDALAARLHFAAVMCAMAIRSPDTIADHGARGLAAARRSGDPVLVNAALVLASWSTVFIDPDAALEQTAEASAIATAADEPLGRDFADGYRAFHLAVLRRYDDAAAIARAVVDRASPNDRAWYPTYVGASALSALWFLDDPDAALPWHELLGSPSVHTSMWARDLVEASIHAAAGRAATASALTAMIRSRLEQAGQDPWPDLLLPPVAHAVHRGDRERAAEWLEAIRSAGRPTQSFQATVMYRRLRDAVGSVDAQTRADDIETTGQRALAWLDGLA